MWDNATITMLLEGVRDTLYMTLASTFFGYVLGLPLGVILAVTDKDGIKPNAFIYKILDIIVNILRSIPFLILLIFSYSYNKSHCGKNIWLHSYCCTFGNSSSTFYCQNGGIFSQGSKRWSD